VVDGIGTYVVLHSRGSHKGKYRGHDDDHDRCRWLSGSVAISNVNVRALLPDSSAGSVVNESACTLRYRHKWLKACDENIGLPVEMLYASLKNFRS
jgi:hypothetical protein